MKRRELVLAGAAVLALPRAAGAQARVARVGFLIPLNEDDPENKARMASFWSGLRQLGWTEGRNIRVEYRYAAGDAAKMRQQAAELAAMAPDLILVHSNQALAVMRQVDRRIPTIFL